VSAIDAHIAELSGILRGPKSAKADLIAEARESLIDAAEAYQDGGMDRSEAEHRAVQDFGTVGEVSPGYQGELGRSQGRRTALLVAGVLVLQPVAWGLAARSPAWTSGQPDPGYAVMDEVVTWLGTAAVAGAIVAALACGFGVRYLSAWRRIIRGVGTFAWAVCGVFMVSGLVMVVLGGQGLLVGLLWMVMLAVLPLVWVAVQAHRCLDIG
jgi:hypothetical protein